jgi:hypothetical protein
MANQTFTVTTDHPVVGAPWGGEHQFTVSQDAGTGQFYAKADAFGMGHYADTPRAAIRSLVKSNGAILISVAAREHGQPPEVQARVHVHAARRGPQ